MLGASCKTERVGVMNNIWTMPNADFVPVFSDQAFMNLKTYARVGVDVELHPPGTGSQSDRQSGLIAEAFDEVRIDLVECDGETLSMREEIVAATLANDRLNARTTIDSDVYTAVVEYPIKTINANERDMIYQTDTGPVLFPDLDCDESRILDGVELAFAAFNCPQWVEFLIRVPTSVTEQVDVFHYSQPWRCNAINEVVRVIP